MCARQLINVHKTTESIQKITDKFIKVIDDVVIEKEKELMEV